MLRPGILLTRATNAVSSSRVEYAVGAAEAAGPPGLSGEEWIGGDEMGARRVLKAVFVGVLATFALGGCLGGGGDADFTGWWELYEVGPGEELYGPTNMICLRQTGSDLYIGASVDPLTVSGDSFSGWGYGDESDGAYVTGTMSGSTMVLTVQYWLSGVPEFQLEYRLLRTSMPLDGSAQGAGTVEDVPVSFNTAPAFALRNNIEDEFTIQAEDAAGSIWIYLGPASAMTAAGIYTVDSDIVFSVEIEQAPSYLYGDGSGGTVTITSITPSRIVGTYDVSFWWGGSLSGSFDVPLKEGPQGPDPDQYEPDDSYSQAATIAVDGGAQDHTFHAAFDADWVKFTVTSTSQTYYIETSNLGLDADTELYLFASDGTTMLTYNDDYVGLASRIEHTFGSTGTYYVMIAELYGELGSYSVEVRTTP